MIKGSGFACGKIILIGEHSVVYGKPAIAVPFCEVKVTSTIESHPIGLYLETDVYEGAIEYAPNSLEGLKVLIYETLNRLNHESVGLKIHLDYSLPPQRGLGYSAAVSVAVIRGLYNAFNQELTEKTLFELTHVAESIHHVDPSGLDAYTIIKEAPVYFEKSSQSPIQLNFSGWLVVADTGVMGNTKDAVRSVKMLDESIREETLQTMHVISETAKEHLEGNHVEEFGSLMNQAQECLRILGVSDESLETLIESALKAGALGAKLTGGGRGGCMIALTKNEEEAQRVADALKESGAVSTWTFALKGRE